MLVTIPGQPPIMAQRHGGPHAGLLALHGWGRDRHDWDTVLSGTDALAVDLPGFGATAEPETPWTTAQYACRLASALGKEPMAIIGHSFGGRIAVHIAAQEPDRVKALILTGVPLLRPRAESGRNSPIGFRIAKTLRRIGMIPESVLEAARGKYGSRDYLESQGIMRQILIEAVNEDYSKQLALIAKARIPVALIWGAQDSAAPLSIAERSLEILGCNAHLTVVPASGHILDGALINALRGEIACMLEAC